MNRSIKMPIRHANHQLSAESQKAFVAEIPPSWVVRSINDDYGIDFEVEIFNENGQATSDRFYVQLKSTNEKKEHLYLKEELKVSTYNYLMKQRYPVLLVKYIKPDNKMLYRWVFEKLRKYPSEKAKSLTLNFEKSKEFNKSNLGFVLNDLKRFHTLLDKRFLGKISFKLTSDNIFMSKTSLLHAQKKMSKGGSFEVEFDEQVFDGEVKIIKNQCFISIGGGSSSFGFFFKENSNPDELLKKILLGTGILLSRSRVVNLSGRILAKSYDVLDFFINPDFIVSVLLGLFTSKEYAALAEAYFWMLSNLTHKNEVKMVSFMLYKNYDRNSDAEQSLVEDMLLSNVISDSIDGDSLSQSASEYSLGNFYRSVGREAESVEMLNHARKTSSDYLERAYYWQELGVVTYNRRKFKWAMRFYKNALKLEKSRTLNAYIGDCYFSMRDILGAKKYYEGAFKIKEGELNPHYFLKANCLSLILKLFHVKGDKGVYKDLANIKSPKEKTLLKHVETDLLDPHKWFNLGVHYSSQHEHVDAMFSFLWCALLYESDVEAWTNAFISAFNILSQANSSEKDQLSKETTLIFTAAYSKNGTAFISNLFQFIDKNIKKGQEEIKSFILQMSDVLGKEDDFEFRLINPDLTVKKMKV